MGLVLRAHHAATGEPVALKVMAPGASGDGEARLRREADAIARLDHPGIVKLRGRGSTADGRYYMAMELVDGSSLHDLVARNGIGLIARVTAVAEAARAMEHAHAHDVLHRDLKPANILVDRSGRAKVVDFGLGKLFDDAGGTQLTAPGMAVGTLPYMSPEELTTGKIATAPSDIYGLAATLYHTITGRPPFEATTAQLARQIVSKMPPAPSTLAPAGTFPGEGGAPSPEDLDAVCLQSLAKDPRDRHPSAEAFAVDLERVLAGDRPKKTSGRRLPARERPPSGRKHRAPSKRARRPSARVRRPPGAMAISSPPPTAGGRAAVVGLALGIGVLVGVIVVLLALGGNADPGGAGGGSATGPTNPDAPSSGGGPDAPDGPGVSPPERLPSRYESAARLTAGHLERDEPREALEAYRELRIGADLDRLGQALRDESPEVRARLWSWAAVDRAIFGDEVELARAREQALKAGARRAPVIALAEAVRRELQLCFRGNPHQARVALGQSEVDPGRLGALLDPSSTAALFAFVDLRALVPTIVRGDPVRVAGARHAGTEISAQPAAMAPLVSAVLDAARARAAACHEASIRERIQGRIPEIARRSCAFLDSRRWMASADDGMTDWALGAVGPWSHDDSGLRWSTAAPNGKGLWLGGALELVVREPNRFASIELWVEAETGPARLGLELRRSGAVLAHAIAEASAGAVTIGNGQPLPPEFYQRAWNEREAGAPESDRRMIVRIYAFGQAGKVYYNVWTRTRTGIKLGNVLPDGESLADTVLGLRLAPGTIITRATMIRRDQPAPEGKRYLKEVRAVEAETAPERLWVRLVSPEPQGNLEGVQLEGGVKGRDGELRLTQGGHSKLRWKATFAHRPSVAFLRIGHLTAMMHLQEKGRNEFGYSPVTLRINDRIVVEDLDPIAGMGFVVDRFDVADFLREGENNFELALGQRAVSHYWVKSIELRHD